MNWHQTLDESTAHGFSAEGAAFVSPGRSPGFGAACSSALKGRHNRVTPFQGWGNFSASSPKALPWADELRPFRAAANATTPVTPLIRH
jgi:hypothetical protein